MMPDEYGQGISPPGAFISGVSGAYGFVPQQQQQPTANQPSMQMQTHVQTRAQAQQAAAAQAHQHAQAQALQAQSRAQQQQQNIYPTRLAVMQGAAQVQGSAGPNTGPGSPIHLQTSNDQYRSPQGAPTRTLTSQRSFPGAGSTPSDMLRMQQTHNQFQSPTRERKTTIRSGTGLGISTGSHQFDSSGSPFGGQRPPGTPMGISSYAGEPIFAGMELTTSAPITPHTHATPSQASTSTNSSTPWQHDDYSLASSATSFVITEPGTSNQSPSRPHNAMNSDDQQQHPPQQQQQQQRMQAFRSNSDDVQLTEAHLASVSGGHYMSHSPSNSFHFSPPSADNTSSQRLIPLARPPHDPRQSASSVPTTSSAPVPPPALALMPTDRSRPSKDVSSNRAMTKSYIHFVFYCNPQIPLSPAPVGVDELARLFNTSPKSGDKRFTPLEIFNVMNDDQNKGKTWVKLAEILGVEEGESHQRRNQYGVRLKKYMLALHIDAFFDYLTGKRNDYYAKPHPMEERPTDGKDAVIKTLLHGRPRRGRRKNGEGTSTPGGSVSSVVPAKRGRVQSAASIFRNNAASDDGVDDEDWPFDVDDTPDSASISTSMWVDGADRMSPPDSSASVFTTNTADFANAFSGLNTVAAPMSMSRTESSFSIGDKMDMEGSLPTPAMSTGFSNVHTLLPSVQLGRSGHVAKRPRLRNADDLHQLAAEDDFLRQGLASAGLSGADIVRCLGLIAARGLLPSMFGVDTGARHTMSAPCRVSEFSVRRNSSEPDVSRRRSTRTTTGATGGASKKGSGESVGSSSGELNRRAGTAFVISWSVQRSAMKASLEVELGDGEAPSGDALRDEDEARIAQLQAVVSEVRGVLAQHGCL